MTQVLKLVNLADEKHKHVETLNYKICHKINGEHNIDM